MLHVSNRWIWAGVVSVLAAMYAVWAAAGMLSRIDTAVAALKTDVNTLTDVLQVYQSKLDRVETTLNRTATTTAALKPQLDRLIALAAKKNGGLIEEVDCENWSHKTKPGEMAQGSINPHVETANCLKCLPLPLPPGLQCVVDRPPKIIRKSYAHTRKVDPEDVVRRLLRAASSGKTFVDVGLFDGRLLTWLAEQTDHKMIGFEPQPGVAEEIQHKLDRIMASQTNRSHSAKAIAAGVSSEVGTMELNIRKSGTTAGSSFACALAHVIQSCRFRFTITCVNQQLSTGLTSN